MTGERKSAIGKQGFGRGQPRYGYIAHPTRLVSALKKWPCVVVTKPRVILPGVTAAGAGLEKIRAS